MNTIIRKVILALDTVEVKGRNNMDTLLGCITALETVSAALEAAARTSQEVQEPKEEEQEVANG